MASSRMMSSLPRRSTLTEVEWESLADSFVDRDTAITIGVFDGVHRGHVALLREVTRGALVRVVVTFEQHPSKRLVHDSIPGYVMSLDQRREALAALDIDLVVLVRFSDRVRRMQGKEFLDRLLTSFSVRRIAVGGDFAVGRDRAFALPELETLAHSRGFEVATIDPVEVEGEVVSSSRLRRLIRDGALERAMTLLGRPYTLDVAESDTTTTNDHCIIRVSASKTLSGSGQLIPPDGVYDVTLIDEHAQQNRSRLTVEGNNLNWPLADAKSIRYIVMNHNRIGSKE